MNIMRFSILLTILFFLPFFAFAQVVITEIMYDLEGSDTDREWVEIYNTGSAAVDLADWRFVDIEADEEKQHKLLPYPEDGDVVVQPHTYAVIVIKPDVFLGDWPGFPGMILDSNFSLRQQDGIGETLAIRNPEGVDVDSVTYDPAWGANGNGDSLQKDETGWYAAAPTPGKDNAAAGAQTGDSEGGSESASSTQTTGTQSSTQPADKGGSVGEAQIKAHIEKYPQTAVVGVAAEFRGSATGLTGEPIGGARYLWSFGDGEMLEGQNVFYAYGYPGRYKAVLDVASGKYAASESAMVTVISSEVSIASLGTDADSYVELSNESSYEINLGGWFLAAGNAQFQIPKNTFILPESELIFGAAVTGFSELAGKSVSLLYPNGTTAGTFKEESEDSKTPAPIAQTTPTKTPYTQSGNEQNKPPARTPKPPEQKTQETQEAQAQYDTKDDEAFDTALLAQAIVADEEEGSESGIFKWLLALALLLAFAIVSATFVKKNHKLADEFTIIEESADKKKK